MLPITTLATGSSGNCYLVQVGNKYIILDAGVKLEKIKQQINLNDVLFAFISHEHKDHSGSMEALRDRGVKVVYGKYLNKPFGPKQIDDVTFWTIPIKHGDCPNCAIMIKYQDDLLLYATDFNMCTWNLSKFKFTQIMVECNYLERNITDVLNDKENENYSRALRQINTHMGLNGLISFLDKLDLSSCKEIYLVHQSLTFGNGAIMGGMIYGLYKIPTKVCKQYGGVWDYGSR